MTNDRNALRSELKEQALLLMNGQRLEEARSLYSRICEDDPNDVECWYSLSNINGMLGRLDDAGECCRRILAISPGHCEAHINLGNALLCKGQPAAAEEEYLAAIEINPAHAVANYSLGNLLQTQGKYEEATSSYLAAVQANPKMAIAFFSLGNLQMSQGQYEQAVDNYGQVLRIGASDTQVAAIREQGRILVQKDRFSEAKDLFSNLCQRNPRDAQSWLALGITYGKLGDYDEVADCCRRVLAIRQDIDEAHVNLGHVYFMQGLFDESILHYRRALEINPRNIVPLNNMGRACRTDDHLTTYIECYRKSITEVADPSEARNLFFWVIMRNTPRKYDPWLETELQEYLGMGAFENKPLIEFALEFLKVKHNIRPAFGDDSDVSQSQIEKLAADELFITILENVVNIDADVESLIHRLRRSLLLVYCDGKMISPSELRLVYVLARQGHNNEYVLSAKADERRRIVKLRAVIEKDILSMTSPDAVMERRLAVFAMYEPLVSLSCRELIGRIPLVEWSELFRPLVTEALINVMEEEGIKDDIESFGDITDPTSLLVQSQYEKNPYPRWLTTFEARAQNMGEVLGQMFPHFTFPSYLKGPIRILIAGCGTGQQPINFARKYSGVEVLAVDISKSSLAYAIRMARKYGVDNIEFMQGDILQLDKLGRRFHVIVCCGVLHHMKDPLAGWQMLTGLLVENGLMWIGLYSEAARRGVVEVRNIIKEMELTPDLETIRNFRERMLRREFGERMYKSMRYCWDFYSISSCRDLIFHHQEHRYTLPQLRKELEMLNLEFIGFKFNDAKNASAYRKLFPEDKDMTDLLLWARFEDKHPGTFGGMYDFWCQSQS